MFEGMDNRKLNLVVSFHLEGTHRWAGAPEKYKEFSKPHEHRFTFFCVVPVKKPRELELYDLRNQLIAAIKAAFGAKPNFGNLSCEEIAKWVSDWLYQAGYGICKAFVGEDGFMGALIC